MAQPNLFSAKPSNHATLEELFAEMKQMRDDPLASAGTNIVISRGNPQAKLLIIGEAPGPEENVKGKPFVGRAGQLLDIILQAAGFDPEKDVYITNSVFRLPPGEDGKAFRKPTDEEIKYYRPYVLEIIRLVDPLIMLLTGNVACQSILGKTGFSVGAAMGRNRLIYTLADYAIVVASDSETGGTWAGATETLKNNWVPVFVLEHVKMPDGNKLLLQRGALAFPHPFKEAPVKLAAWMKERSASIPSEPSQPSLL